MTCDIDHLEACVRLFEQGERPFTGTPYVVHHRARKGTVRKFIRETLRTAQAPLTSAQLTDMWIADRGLRTDHDTTVTLRKRIGAALIALRRALAPPSA